MNGDGGLSAIDVLIQINELRRLNIPVPSYGSSGSIYSTGGVIKSGNGSWVLSGNTTIGGGLTATGVTTNAGGSLVLNGSPFFSNFNPIQHFGSITVNPYVSINNTAKMSVTGRTITIQPGARVVEQRKQLSF